MSWWRRGRGEPSEGMNALPGELHVSVPDDGTDRLCFSVNVVDDEGGGRYTVVHDREEVCVLVRRLRMWLGGSCDDEL
jgi:hypothetical protein